MSDGRGYLLPDGDAYTDEVACVLLFYPDKDEYRRALRGALDYFGVWLAWERDSAKRGQDAARAWKEANILTYECMDMNYCGLILANLDAILNLLSQQHCCDGTNSVTYFDQTIVNTTIVPGVGDPPSTWGESEEPVDWDDWSQYVCYHAHLYVDYLIESAGLMDTLVTLGSWGVDFLSFILSRIIYGSPSGGIVPVNFGWVNTISNLLLDALGTLDFDTLEDKFEAAREDIVCALMLGESLEDAVEAAVDDSVLWAVYYMWLGYDSTVATIYTGEVPEVGYLTPSQRDDCVCGGAEYEERWDYDTGIEDPWIITGDGYWSGGAVVLTGNGTLQAWAGDMRVWLGLGSTGSVTVHRLKFGYKRSTEVGTPSVKIFHDGGTWEWVFADLPVGTAYEKEFFFDPPLVCTHPMNPFVGFFGASSANIVRIYWTELDMDA